MPNFIPGLKASVGLNFKTLSELMEERKRAQRSRDKGESAKALSRCKRVFCGKDDSGSVVSMSRREFERLTWRI